MLYTFLVLGIKLLSLLEIDDPFSSKYDLLQSSTNEFNLIKAGPYSDFFL